MSFRAGENVGSYRIIEKLGQGGMATVFKAYHASLDRYVALKVLHPAFKEDPQFLERFTREARVVARLEHPNIVQVYDFAEHEGQPYLVMKYIEGQTLKARLQRGPLTKSEAIKTIRAIGEALSYAHNQGVLHRDVKPSNILLSEEGRVFLTDFGLARMAEAGASTLTGDMLMGTPQYISPEQARGEKNLTERTDIYSFGIVLYEIVVGRVPFSADTPFSIIHDHIYTPLPLPREVNPKIPLAIQEVLLKALAKQPEDRYASGEALVEAFSKSITLSDEKVIVPEELQDTKSAHKEVSEPADLGESKAESKLSDRGEEIEIVEGGVLPQKRFESKWMWIAVGLVISCLSLFAILSVFNQSGIRTLFDRTNVSATEESFAMESNPSGLIDEARRELEGHLDDPQAHLKLADAYKRGGMQEDAAGEFIQAGMLFFDQNRVKEGINALLEAIILQGGFRDADPEIVERVVEELFNSAKDANLASMYANVSDLFPNWEIVKICEARNILYRGELKEARTLIEEFLKNNSTNYLANTVMAEVKFQMGNHREALSIVKELLNIPNLPEWLVECLNQFETEIRSKME
jgi:serine/threonine protein kinase